MSCSREVLQLHYDGSDFCRRDSQLKDDGLYWLNYFHVPSPPRFCIASSGTRVPSICAIKHFFPVFCSRPPSLRTVLMYNNDVEYCSCQPALPCFRTLRLLWAFRVLILGERIGNFINLIKYCMSETAKQRGKFAVCFSELRKLGRIKKERFSYRRRCQVIMLMRLFAWLGKQWALGCRVFIMQCYVGESFKAGFSVDDTRCFDDVGLWRFIVSKRMLFMST